VIRIDDDVDDDHGDDEDILKNKPLNFCRDNKL